MADIPVGHRDRRQRRVRFIRAQNMASSREPQGALNREHDSESWLSSGVCVARSDGLAPLRAG
jgi:hypothetical protein